MRIILAVLSALLALAFVCLGIKEPPNQREDTGQGGSLDQEDIQQKDGGLAQQQDSIFAWFVSRRAEPGEPLVVKTLKDDAFVPISYEWYVNGERIENGEAYYMPEEADLEKMISVTVRADGCEPQNLTAYCSRLPVLYIDVENGWGVSSKTDYLNANYILQGAGEWRSQTQEGEAEIKARGNDSYQYDKKSFRLKLAEKADLLGMGKNRHWVLLANYLDTSLMRNGLAYSLAQSMGLEPGIENRWVSLVMNGEYAGNYQLAEQVRIGEGRIQITNWNNVAERAARACVGAGMIPEEKLDLLEASLKAHLGWLSTRVFVFEDQPYELPLYLKLPPLTGGFVLELDAYYDEPSKFRTERGLPIMFHQPEAAATNEALFSYAKEYIQALEDGVWAEDGYTQYGGRPVHYSELLDVDSMVKYWLICEYFFNVDIFDRNCFMYKDIEGKLYMGPLWDMDWSTGYEAADMSATDWAIFYMNRESQLHSWGLALTQKKDFLDRAYEIYWEYHDEMEELTAQGGRLEQYYEYLYESAIANEEKWLPEGGNGFERETMEVVRLWLTKRLEWMDEQFSSRERLYQSMNQD